jgi:hypothetical protein
VHERNPSAGEINPLGEGMAVQQARVCPGAQEGRLAMLHNPPLKKQFVIPPEAGAAFVASPSAYSIHICLPPGRHWTSNYDNEVLGKFVGAFDKPANLLFSGVIRKPDVQVVEITLQRLRTGSGVMHSNLSSNICNFESRTAFVSTSDTNSGEIRYLQMTVLGSSRIAASGTDRSSV